MGFGRLYNFTHYKMIYNANCLLSCIFLKYALCFLIFTLRVFYGIDASNWAISANELPNEYC